MAKKNFPKKNVKKPKKPPLKAKPQAPTPMPVDPAMAATLKKMGGY